jgi:hypothetical protein
VLAYSPPRERLITTSNRFTYLGAVALELRCTV